MGGGLMQLVAYGAQDVYLTGQPQITFFKALYKRHTNFAMENVEQTIDGAPVANGKSMVTIERQGDLVQQVYLEFDADVHNAATGVIPWLAEDAVADIELTIGGQKIDKHYARWWRIYSEMNYDNAKKANYSKMTNVDTSGAGTNAKIFLPLTFFFNRHSGLALPLIALQYQEVKLEFTWSSNFNTNTNQGYPQNPRCWANYIYLDTDERRIFADKPHEYLIETVQHTGAETVTAGSTNNIRLNYNHPVKELLWWFPKSTDATANAYQNPTTNGFNFVTEPVVGEQEPHLSSGVVRILATQHVGETADGPLDSFYLQLNGTERFKSQPGKYFNSVQPFQTHSGCPMPGLYSYSFALQPEKHQPSGTCNFSRVDTATATVSMKAGATSNTNMYMFAHGYNVLRVQNGTCGLAYSN
jgi:hypothetical protein